jgi:hypothetical protein
MESSLGKAELIFERGFPSAVFCDARTVYPQAASGERTAIPLSLISSGFGNGIDTEMLEKLRRDVQDFADFTFRIHYRPEDGVQIALLPSLSSLRAECPADAIDRITRLTQLVADSRHATVPFTFEKGILPLLIAARGMPGAALLDEITALIPQVEARHESVSTVLGMSGLAHAVLHLDRTPTATDLRTLARAIFDIAAALPADRPNFGYALHWGLVPSLDKLGTSLPLQTIVETCQEVGRMGSRVAASGNNASEAFIWGLNRALEAINHKLDVPRLRLIGKAIVDYVSEATAAGADTQRELTIGLAGELVRLGKDSTLDKVLECIRNRMAKFYS